MADASRLLFLVPAHNEQTLIGPCIASLQRLAYPSDRLRVIVIADNCTDATIARVTEAGEEAWARADPANPGKSAALGWAIGQLNLSEWDAVVILDADSTVEPGFAAALAEHGPLQDKVVQAYFGSSNEFDSWLTRLSGVLGRIRYEISYPRKERAGLNVPLTGNGMCIGTGLLLREGWKADSITENWELYARWTAAGVRICYAQGALLLSQEAASLRQGGSQRLRWASGRAEVFRTWCWVLVNSKAISTAQKIDAIWTLGAPSPVIGGLIALGVAGLTWLVLPAPYGVIVGGLALATLLPLLIATCRVIWSHPQRWATIASFIMLPPYALWRVILQIRAAIVGTRQGWVRTARE
jgi:hypothetical protein